MVQITEKGKKSINEHLQLKDIEGDSSFLDFYAEEKQKVAQTLLQLRMQLHKI